MKPDRKFYLESTPLHEALKKWIERLTSEGTMNPLSGERINVIESLGRITSKAVSAKISSPFYHSSAMDGYAVRVTDTFGASERKPKMLRVGEQAVEIDTGDPIPEGFNAVIMIEDINITQGQNSDRDYIEIIAPVTPWQHVRVIGDDIVATELILPENHRIRPVDIGAMLASGHGEVMVRKRPKVVIIPTGSEIVEPGTALHKGNIIEYNSRILGGLITEWGGEPIRYRIVPDEIESLKEALLDSLSRGDLVVINAGASAGSEDFTVQALRDLGDVILHGVNIKPGKPVMLGWIKGKPVVGIPGYPVSAYITFCLFFKFTPLIETQLSLSPERVNYLALLPLLIIFGIFCGFNVMLFNLILQSHMNKLKNAFESKDRLWLLPLVALSRH